MTEPPPSKYTLAVKEVKEESEQLRREALVQRINVSEAILDLIVSKLSII